MTMRQRIWLIFGLALTLVPTAVVPAAFAAVRVDRGFGTAGIARTPLPPSYESESFFEISATPDGGVLGNTSEFDGPEISSYGPEGALLGEETREEEAPLRPPEATTATGGRLVGSGVGGTEDPSGLVRMYEPDGSPDPTFGTNGISESLPFDVEAVAALPSGKLLAAGPGKYRLGTPNKPGFDQIFVARLTAQGKLDPSFGKDGEARLHREDKVSDEKVLHVQARGVEGAEIVGDRGTVVALDAAGGPDRSFGKGGQVTAPGRVVGAGAAAGEALLVAGAKPVRGNSKEEGAGPEELYVARYTAAGSLDPTYAGGSGIAILATEGSVQADTALVEAGGSVLIGGLVQPPTPGCPHGYTCGRVPAVARFTPDGGPDPTFGEGGLVRFPSLSFRIGSSSYLYGVDSLAARPGGGYFAAGESEHAAFIAALGAGGSPPAGFGGGGIVTKGKAEPAYAAPREVAVNGSGDIFVVAETDSEMWLPEGLVVLRYSPDGKLDREYGEEGEAFVPPGAQSLTVGPDGSVYVTSASEATLTKLTPAGSLDPDFGTDGTVSFPSPGGYRFTAWTSSRLPDGDLLVGGDRGTGNGHAPAVLRYLPDGKLDRSFGKAGIAMVTPGRGREWEVGTMAVDGKGRILLAGGAPRRHRNKCCNQPGMVIRLDADGRLDRSFGRGGATFLGGRAYTEISGLAIHGGKVLAVATTYHDRSRGDLVFALGADGRLDRGFGKEGVARALLSPHRTRVRGEEEETAQVLSTAHRVFVIRSGPHASLLSFSPTGHRQRGALRGVRNLFPRRETLNVPPEPVAAADGGDLILAWAGRPTAKGEGGYQGEVNLRRMLVG